MFEKVDSVRGVTKAILVCLIATMVVVMPMSLRVAHASSITPGNSICNLTEATPNLFFISSPLELWEVTDCVAGGNNTFKLINDINVASEANAPTGSPIGSPATMFSGVLDGNQKSVTGLTMSSTSGHVGLFYMLKNALIRDLRVQGTFTYSGTATTTYAGGLAARSVGDVTISGVALDATVSGKRRVGGLVGDASGYLRIDNTTTNGLVGGETSVGGLVGQVSVTGSPLVGKLTVLTSTNSAEIRGSSNAVGGLVGASYAQIELKSAANLGRVSSTTLVLGSIGGLVGLLNQNGQPGKSFIESALNSGEVSGATETGGIAGYVTYADLEIRESRNQGNVVASNSSGGAGGAVGRLAGPAPSAMSLFKFINQGNISAQTKLGGLIGFAENSVRVAVSNSVNIGSVTATSASLGDFAGGLVGGDTVMTTPPSFFNALQVGQVTSAKTSGSIDSLLRRQPTITSVYTNQSPSQWIPVSTDAELRLASTYVGWDFDTVWGFIDCTTNNGFPVLRFAYPGETFRTDGCEAVAGTTATQSATTSSDVATTSSEIVETERGPILFKGPLILAFDKRDIASDTPTQIRVIGVRLNFITGLMVDGKKVEFTKIGTKGMVIELPALSSGVHHLMIETTRYGKLTLFRAFTVK